MFTLISLCVLILGAEQVLVNHKEAKMSQRQEFGGTDYTKEFVNIENSSDNKKANLRIQQDMTLEKRNGKWVFTHSTASMY